MINMDCDSCKHENENWYEQQPGGYCYECLDPNNMKKYWEPKKE